MAEVATTVKPEALGLWAEGGGSESHWGRGNTSKRDGAPPRTPHSAYRMPRNAEPGAAVRRGVSLLWGRTHQAARHRTLSTSRSGICISLGVPRRGVDGRADARRGAAPESWCGFQMAQEPTCPWASGCLKRRHHTGMQSGAHVGSDLSSMGEIWGETVMIGVLPRLSPYRRRRS